MAKDTRPFVKRRVIFKGRRLTLIQDKIRVNGHFSTRDWIKRPKVSAIIAFDEKKRIVLVSQFRHGANKKLWELPAGTVDGNEFPITCARRECEEEVGYKPLKLKSLGSFFTSPAASDAKVYLYLADKTKKTQTNPDPDEKIVVKHFTVSQVKTMLRKNVICDAKSVIALYRYFSK